MKNFLTLTSTKKSSLGFSILINQNHKMQNFSAKKSNNMVYCEGRPAYFVQTYVHEQEVSYYCRKFYKMVSILA